ncbi:MAG: Ig-like domain-containing protein, partial [Casimicrobium sp.]
MRIQTSFVRFGAALLTCFAWSIANAQVSLTTIGTPVTQNFDSLANAGTNVAWADNTTIAGWYSTRATYNAGTGSSNTGSLYSFGSAAAPTDRALGGVASGGTATFYWAVRLVNNTGTAITSLDVSYTGEQWRDGGNATPAAQSLQVQYQVAAASTITDADTPTAGWNAVSSLTFTSPTFTTTAGAIDGNASANRANISATITGLNIAPGEEIWLRWVDGNDTGNDHGLAIDNLSITPNGAVVNAAPTVASVAPVNGATGVAQNATLSVTFSESVNLATNAVTLECPSATPIALTANTSNPSTTFTFTPNTSLPASTTCNARVVAANVTESAATALPMAADFTWSFATGVAADSAPSVTSTTPANAATGVAPAATITVNFSEPVDVSSGGITLECPAATPIAFTGLPATNATSLVLTPTAPLPLNTTCTVSVLAANVTDVDANDPPDNLAANYVFSFTTSAPTPINQIQGNGSASPIVGSTVITRGIVTAVYPGFRGFYIQTPDVDVDANPATSEGIFVFMNSATLPAAAVVGNLVQVTGVVGEFGTAPSTATQLGSGSATPTVTQISTGNPLPAAINVSLPLADATALERYEGMRVNFSQQLTVSGNFTLGRFGEIVLSSSGRLINPSNTIDLNDDPASGNTITGNSNLAAITAALDANRLNQVTLDDATSTQNPDPTPFGVTAANADTLRAGSTITGLTGIVNQIAQGYRILSDPSNLPSFNRAARPLTPPAVGGTMKAAGFNVLNYFNGNGTNQDGAAGG